MTYPSKYAPRPWLYEPIAHKHPVLSPLEEQISELLAVVAINDMQRAAATYDCPVEPRFNQDTQCAIGMTQQLSDDELNSARINLLKLIDAYRVLTRQQGEHRQQVEQQQIEPRVLSIEPREPDVPMDEPEQRIDSQELNRNKQLAVLVSEVLHELEDWATSRDIRRKKSKLRKDYEPREVTICLEFFVSKGFVQKQSDEQATRYRLLPPEARE